MTMMIKPDKNRVYVQNMLNAWPLDGTVTGGSSRKDMYVFFLNGHFLNIEYGVISTLFTTLLFSQTSLFLMLVGSDQLYIRLRIS